MKLQWVGILCAAWACVTGCGSQTPRNSWEARAAIRTGELADSLRARGPNVIWLGDSIVEGWLHDGRESWQAVFEDLGAMNLGIGGERTTTLRDRVAAWPRPQRPPRLIILHVGTNDTSDGPVSAVELAARIQETAAQVDSLWRPETVMVSALLPRDPTPTPRREMLSATNEILRVQSIDGGYLFANAGRQFLADDGSIPESLMPDALHLSAEGYRLWSEELAPMLESALNDETRPLTGTFD